MLKTIYSVISVVLLIFITIFAISNREVVDLSFFPFTKKHSLPVYGLVLLSALFGFACGSLLMLVGLLKSRLKNNMLTKALKNNI
jgi:uncharacterized integral membrane protein